jgi:hypothetical protein
MQPYLFAYLGYYQLIHAVDVFITHDDVQFIRRGWINRNRFLVQGKVVFFTFSLKKASHKRLITERYFVDTFDNEKARFLCLLTAYKKAPFYEETLHLVEEVLNCDEKNVAKFVIQSIRRVCAHLDITTPFYISSQMDRDKTLRGSEAIIEVIKKFKADHYINAIGGQDLYSKEHFAERGITLHFIKMNPISYKQGSTMKKDAAVQDTPAFIRDLSIIDVLMFNGKAKTKQLLDEYTLI